MNDSKDLSDLINEISIDCEEYLDKIDLDHMISIMLGFCKAFALEKGLSNKEIRRALKTLIDLQIRE